MYQAYPMLTTGDRLVTPTMSIPVNARGGSLVIPALDDAANIFIERSPLPHRLNYPYCGPDYATGGVVLEFDFDDADGTVITDRVHNVQLTEQGDPAFQQASALAGLGKMITFDGTGDAFDILVANMPEETLINTGDFTVEIVYLGTNASIGAGDTLACCRAGAAGVGWQLQFDANQHMDFHIEDADQQVASEDGTDVATDAAVHLVVSADRDGNAVTYTNGAADKTTSIAIAEKTIRPANGASNRFAIGGDAARTAGDCFFGNMYFFRLYNRALGATEVLQNYNVLMGTGAYPGWSYVSDDSDGTPLIVYKTGESPQSFPLSPRLLETLKGASFRLRASVAQTTTPQDLQFGLEYF